MFVEFQLLHLNPSYNSKKLVTLRKCSYFIIYIERDTFSAERLLNFKINVYTLKDHSENKK